MFSLLILKRYWTVNRSVGNVRYHVSHVTALKISDWNILYAALFPWKDESINNKRSTGWRPHDIVRLYFIGCKAVYDVHGLLQMTTFNAVEFVWSQIARFMGPTWGPPGSCRPQMDPTLVPWTLLSGMVSDGLDHNWRQDIRSRYDAAGHAAHIRNVPKFAA